MAHDLAFRTALAAGLGLVAAAGNLIGGYFVVRRDWPRRYLQYFLALGAGYMLAVAFLDVIPESIHLAGEQALVFVLIGYFLVHLFEHTIAPHFHFGEETHHEEMSHHHARTTILLGLTIHTFFDGVAIAAGFLVSVWLGAMIFVAVFLHKLPEGFTVASRGAGQRTRAAQRNPRGWVIRSSDAAGSFADERAAEPTEIRAADFRRSDALCCCDRFAAGSEPGTELENGRAGLCGVATVLIMQHLFHV